jgi:hypothetical protein
VTERQFIPVRTDTFPLPLPAQTAFAAWADRWLRAAAIRTAYAVESYVHGHAGAIRFRALHPELRLAGPKGKLP